MPGAGTKTAITTSKPPARLLDLTRLASRVGRGPLTGVDRVERAYLEKFLELTDPVFALVRLATGFALLDRPAMVGFLDRFDGAKPWGKTDIYGHLSRKLSPARRASESGIRRDALAQSRRRGLAAMVQRYLPVGTQYFNTGHSNLSEASFAALHRVEGLLVNVLIHDVIPLQYPQYQRVGTVASFQTRMRAVSAQADRVIYNSAQSQHETEKFFAEYGRVPDAVVSHLGVTSPEKGPVPAGIEPVGAYFVTLGTIEPRKNHALLLDVWQDLAHEMPSQDLPELLIIGARGWNNDAVFARLDQNPPGVRELSDLGDGAVATLLAGAQGFLFPSLAEGFGLPPVEAALLGVPVICGDLAIYREILGDIPVYLKENDRYLWGRTIRKLAEQQKTERVRAESLESLSWDHHFNRVLKVG